MMSSYPIKQFKRYKPHLKKKNPPAAFYPQISFDLICAHTRHLVKSSNLKSVLVPNHLKQKKKNNFHPSDVNSTGCPLPADLNSITYCMCSLPLPPPLPVAGLLKDSAKDFVSPCNPYKWRQGLSLARPDISCVVYIRRLCI